MFNPLVSIVIPVYNGANYLREAIDSALKQTYSNIEVIVVNDGSRDDGATERIAESYGNKIRYFCKENGGVATALNFGVEKMKGEYFSWLSHDDKYKPQKIENQIRYLETVEDKTLILFGGYENFNDKDGVFDQQDFLKEYTDEQLSTPLFPVLHMVLNGCTMLIHRSHFQRVGGFDPKLPTTQDYDLWFRMLRGQRAKCLPGCQVMSRSHPDQGSKALMDTHIEECEKLWCGVLNSLTDEEKIAVSGDLYSFYREMYEFYTTHTDYPKINSLVRSKAFQELEKMKIPHDRFYNEIYKNLNIKHGNQHVINAVSEQRKDKKRIVYFLGDVNALGGLNRIVLQTADLLTKWYDVWLIDTKQYNGTGYRLGNAIKEVTCDFIIQDIADIAQIIDADVFIGSYNCLDAMLQIYAALLKTGIKIVAWNHENFFLPYVKHEFNRVLKYRMGILNKVDVVVWLTSYSQKLYETYAQNGVVIPNISGQIGSPKNSDQIRSKLGFGNKNKVIISVGRFDDGIKHIEKIINAFSLIHKADKNTKLILVGPYDLNMRVTVKKDILRGDQSLTLKQILEDRKTPADSIYFTGQIKNVEDYYDIADVQLFASSCEGFGLVINEAAQFNVPTIAMKHNGYEEIIVDGETGAIVEDEIEMAQKTIEWLSKPDMLKQIGENAKNRVNKFEEEQVLQKWRRLIESITKGEKAFDSYMRKERNERTELSTEEYKWAFRTMGQLYAEAYNHQATGYTGNGGSANDSYWQQLCNTMENTISWKITKPLRSIRQIQKQIAKRIKNH